MSDASVSRAEYANRPVSRGYCEVMLHDSSEIVRRLARAHLELLDSNMKAIEELRIIKADLLEIKAGVEERLDKLLASGVYRRHMSRPLKDRDDIDALPDPPEAK